MHVGGLTLSYIAVTEARVVIKMDDTVYHIAHPANGARHPQWLRRVPDDATLVEMTLRLAA
jgi:hypothetical protein